jgi:SAM-dependent methyltransferase
MLPRYGRKSILDLGAGDGRISVPLVGDQDDLLLVDSSPRMLELALQNVPPKIAGQVQALCLDAADFVPTRTFDVVLCIGLLAHVPDWIRILYLMERCLGPSGCALIQITDQERYLGRLTRRLVNLNRTWLDRSLHMLNRLTISGVEAELQRLGLALAEVRRYALVPGVRLAPSSVARTVVAAASSTPVAEYGGEVLALLRRKQAV